MPSPEKQDFFDEQDAPEIPYELLEWIEKIFPTPPVVMGRNLDSWNFLAGIEEVKRTLKQAFIDQAGLDVHPGSGVDPLGDLI